MHPPRGAEDALACDIPEAMPAELALLALSGVWYADRANFIYRVHAARDTVLPGVSSQDKRKSLSRSRLGARDLFAVESALTAPISTEWGVSDIEPFLLPWRLGISDERWEALTQGAEPTDAERRSYCQEVEMWTRRFGDTTWREYFYRVDMPSCWHEAKSVYFSYRFLGEFPGTGRAGPFALWEDVAAYITQKYADRDCVYIEQEPGRDYVEYQKLIALLPNAEPKTSIH